MARVTSPPNQLHWTRRRDIALATCLVALLLAAPLGLRAIDTGSLQQYFLLGVLLIVAVNRFYTAIRRKKTA